MLCQSYVFSSQNSQRTCHDRSQLVFDSIKKNSKYLNSPLLQWGFSGQRKKVMEKTMQMKITQFNIPIGSRQIDQLAIYKRGGGVELGSTEKNLQLSWSERDDLTRNPIKKSNKFRFQWTKIWYQNNFKYFTVIFTFS